LRELADAEWLTTSITHRDQEELGEVFSSHRLPPPRLALRSQSALTMIISLMHSDLLAMVPDQMKSFSVTADALVAIPIAETLPSRPTVTIRRGGVPLTPAAEFLIDLIRRAGALATVAGRTAAAPVADRG
jgi:DNA-binding transcriptional LysR family regulator